jgi:recombination protein RecT
MAKLSGDDMAKKTASSVPATTGGTVKKAPQSMVSFLESMKPQIARALPAGMDPDRITRLVLTTMRMVPKLMDCTPASLAGAVMQSAQLGLEFGPLGLAYLVPYTNRKFNRVDAQLIIGYKGYLQLAHRSKDIKSVYAEIIYEKDFFEVTYGLKRDIQHKPPAFGTDRGTPVGAYAVGLLTEGEPPFIVMTLAEVEKIRRRSSSPDDGPWKTDYEAMVKKTVVKQLCKWLPLSTDVLKAIGADESVKTEIVDNMLDIPSEVDQSDTIDAEAVDVTDEVDEAKNTEPPVKQANPQAADPLAGDKKK